MASDVEALKKNGDVDYEALETLVNWYIDQGVAGLFTVCQSSEQFFLTLEELINVIQTVKGISEGRVPVITSSHVADDIHDQIAEMQAMEKTGAEALILITNRLAREHESDECWIKNCQVLLDELDPQTALGLYEFPYPYKRLLSEKIIEFCLSTGRFYFIKDTCCDADILARRITLTQGSTIKIYNTNTTTLLDSLRKGAAGYSGVMANFHPKLYVWLCENFRDKRAEELAEDLSIILLIEMQYYPVNAKYYLASVMHLPMDTNSRQQNNNGLTDTFKKETFYLSHLTEKIEKCFY